MRFSLIDQQESLTTKDIGSRTRLNICPLRLDSKTNIPSRKSSIEIDPLGSKTYQNYQHFRIISESNSKENQNNSDWFSLTKRRKFISQSQTRHYDLIEEKVRKLKEKLNKGLFDIKIGGQRIKPLKKPIEIPISTFLRNNQNNLFIKTETLYWQQLKTTQEHDTKPQNNKIYKLPSFKTQKYTSLTREPSTQKQINSSRKEYSRTYRNQHLCGWMDNNQHDYYQYHIDDYMVEN